LYSNKLSFGLPLLSVTREHSKYELAP
jgi:hypothetical protein